MSKSYSIIYYSDSIITASYNWQCSCFIIQIQERNTKMKNEVRHHSTKNELIETLKSVNEVREEFASIPVTDLNRLKECHERLVTLYSCIPVSDIIEFLYKKDS
jgi:site-specific DNA-adenine methylase